MCVYIYIHIYIYTHTHMQTYAQMFEEAKENLASRVANVLLMCC
jgi:hypothetical protein